MLVEAMEYFIEAGILKPSDILLEKTGSYGLGKEMAEQLSDETGLPIKCNGYQEENEKWLLTDMTKGQESSFFVTDLDNARIKLFAMRDKFDKAKKAKIANDANNRNI